MATRRRRRSFARPAARSPSSATLPIRTEPRTTSGVASIRAGGRSCRGFKARAREPRVRLGHGDCRDRAIPPPAPWVVQLRARRLARRRAQLELHLRRRLRSGRRRSGAGSVPTSRLTRPAARSPTGTTPGSAPGPTARSTITAALWNLLAHARTEIVLAGHDHDYERFAPVSGIRSFVVGTGGATIPSSSRDRAASSATATTFGVLRLRLAPGGYAWRFLPARQRDVHRRRQRHLPVDSFLSHVAPATERARRRRGGVNASCTTRSTRRAPSLLDRREAAELEPAQLDTALARTSRSRTPRGSRAGRPCGGRGSARTSTRPPGSGTRTPRAPSHPGRAPRRSRRGTATSHPLGSVAGQVGARDEHRVVRRRPGRQVGGAREQPGRAVLHRAEHAAVVVEVDRAPLARTRPRRARSSAPSTPSGCRATATRRSRGTRPAPCAIVPRVSPATREARSSRLPAAPDVVDDDVDGRRRRGRPCARGTPRPAAGPRAHGGRVLRPSRAPSAARRDDAVRVRRP